MKKVKTITIILAIILVTMISFAGLYMKTQNRMENKIKEYSLGRELAGTRVVELSVSTAEGSKPSQEDLTVENYETVKKTIENRIENIGKLYSSVLGPQDYTISLNKENGDMRAEFPEDNNTDLYVYFLTADSKVNIKEKDATTELLSDSMVEEAKITYTANAEGAYQAYLILQLTGDGQAKIEEIKNNYAILAEEVEKIEAEEAKKQEEAKKEGENATTEPATENTTTENTKKIAVLTVAGNKYNIEKIEENKVTVKIGGQTTNQASINSNINAATELAMLINSGKYPITYKIDTNRFEHTDIAQQYIMYFAIVVAVLMLVVFVIFIIKYKMNGLLVSISSVGFMALLLLILRYTNVNISIEGIGAIILALIINTRINQIMLRDVGNIDYKDLLLKIIPVIIIAIVFGFSGLANLSSFGLVMFWGLVLIALYNLTVTKTLLKLRESK